MKKLLILAALMLIAVGSVRADLVWYEGYNYPDGPLIVVSTNASDTVTNWIRHSGSANPSDALVVSHQEQVCSTSGTIVSRQDDVHRLFPAAYTNTAIQVFASFTVMVTNLPSAAGGYFAHFTDNTSSDFFGRLYCLTGTNLALPNTFRLGISAVAATPNQIFPMDLALNTPYQVVVSYDATSAGLDGQLWINPISSSDPSVITGDAVTGANATKIMQAYAFRQASGMGNFFALITNLSIATTFSEAATNVWTTNAVAPVIVYQPVGFTNYIGVSNAISLVANGQGLGNLTYTWRTNGTPITSIDGNPIGNTNVLIFSNPQIADSGTYDVIVTTPYGLSVTSAPTAVSVSFAPVPPTFTQQPVNTSVYPAQNATFTVATTGPGDTTYQWNYGGSPILNATDSTLTITDVQTNNGTTGIYECDAINQYGTNHSSNAVLSVTIPPVLSVYNLRGEVDPVFFLPTNSPSSYYTVVGTVINKQNMAVAPNYQCTITDGRAGISVYCYGGLTNAPSLGDVVQVTGPVDNYSSLEEFTIYSTDPSTSVTILSTGNPAPLPTVLPLSFTNSPAYGGISNALHSYESTLVMLTNVYLTPGGGTNTIAGGDILISDGQGGSLIWYVYYGFTNVIGQPAPAFCYSLTGIMSEFLGGSATDRSSGYEFWVTDPGDIVSTPAPAMTLSMASPGVLTWAAVPYSYSYSVFVATNVTGPYVTLKTGMVFPTALGSFTDSNTSSKTRFYRVTSP